jgi:hypothetical protein
MTPCPPIATYRATSSRASGIPPWLARYVVIKQKKDGGTRYEFLPMIFSDWTYDDVIQAAEAFWATEQARIAARADRLAAARDTRKRRGMEGTE